MRLAPSLLLIATTTVLAAPVEQERSYGTPFAVLDQGDMLFIYYREPLYEKGHPCATTLKCRLLKSGTHHDAVEYRGIGKVVEAGDRWRLEFSTPNITCFFNKDGTESADSCTKHPELIFT